MDMLTPTGQVQLKLGGLIMVQTVFINHEKVLICSEIGLTSSLKDIFTRCFITKNVPEARVFYLVKMGSYIDIITGRFLQCLEITQNLCAISWSANLCARDGMGFPMK